jgi:TrpR-related protein YerC/YecD|tara:strand:+ start:151 stop:411 length:261 start_codon:yes stop_codon:yes gene_type:complete
MDLFKVIVAIESDNQARAFLNDLCTPKEIDTLVERWEVAKLLSTKQYSYREIASQLGASTATVTRVARFLFNENNEGYKSLIKNND